MSGRYCFAVHPDYAQFPARCQATYGHVGPHRERDSWSVDGARPIPVFRWANDDPADDAAEVA